MNALRHRKYTPLFWMMLSLALFQIAFNGWMVYRSFYLITDSDYANSLLFSELLAEEGHWFFSANWFNATEINVINIEKIMIPLFHMNLGYREITVITAVVMAAALCGCGYTAMRLLSVQPDMAMFGAWLLIFPFTSFSFFTLLYPCYTWFLMLGVMGLALVMKSQLKPLRPLLLACLIAAGLLSGLTSSRVLLLCVLPIGIFPVLRWCLGVKGQPLSLRLLGEGWRQWRQPVYYMLAGAAGYAFVKLYVEARYGGTIFQPALSGWEDITSYLNTLPTVLLSFAGLGEGYGNSMGVILARGTSLLFTGALLMGGVYLWRQQDKPVSVMLSRFAMFSFCFCVIALLNLGSGGGGTFLARYLMLGWFPLFLMLPMALDRLPRRSVACIAAVLVCLSAFAVRTYQGQSFARIMPPGDRGRSDAVLYLCENDYSFGYASYWNGSVNTIRTDGQLRFQPVYYYEDRVVLRQWFSRKDYIEREPEFFLFSTEEWQECRKANWPIPGKVVFQDDEFVVTDVRGLYNSFKDILREY